MKEIRQQTIHLRDYLGMMRYAPLVGREITIRVFYGLAVTGTYVAQAFALAGGMSRVLDRRGARACVPWFLAAFFCILLRAYLMRSQEQYTKKLGGRIKQKLRDLLVTRLFALGPGYLDHEEAGRVQVLVTDGVEYLEPFYARYLPQVFVTLFSVVPIAAYISSRSLSCGLIVITCTVFSILLPHLLTQIYMRTAVTYWQDYAGLNAACVDVMQGMNTLKLFGAETRTLRDMKEGCENFRKKQTKSTAGSLLSSSGISAIAGAESAFTTLAAVCACQAGALSVADLVVILFLVIEAVRPTGELNSAWHACMMGFSVTQSFEKLMRTQPPAAERDGSVQEGLEMPPAIGFHDVSFRYEEDRPAALAHVSLTAQAGALTAVAGESGSGKSTLVNLLLRFYDAGEGRITLNGTDIRHFSLSYLRSRIAVVFQDTYLFYGTVAENIAMAAETATREEIIGAAEMANADGFISDLPEGYDTMLGEKGSTLSGGQRQRIAIARAILKQASLLILDEPTSGVDPESERLILASIAELRGRMTILMITHRLSTADAADRLIVLEGGRVAECGTPESLKDSAVYGALRRVEEDA